KSATASANEREDDKERKNDEVEARNRPGHPPARKEDDLCPDVSTVRDAQSCQPGDSGAERYKQETKIEFIVMLRAQRWRVSQEPGTDKRDDYLAGDPFGYFGKGRTDSRFQNFRASNQKVTGIWTIGHS